MIDELFFSAEVAVVRTPDDSEDAGAARRIPKPTAVRYCDICRRWGQDGTHHICWRNWRRHLSDLLVEMTRDGRR